MPTSLPIQSIKLIKQCKTINQLHQVHAHAISNGSLTLPSASSSANFLTKILDCITTLTATTTTKSSKFLLRYAVSVFRAIPNPPTFSYNILIRAHTLLCSPLPALHFFAQMRRFSVPFDHHSFPFALKACAQLRALCFAESLHSQAYKLGFRSDLYVLNSLIHVYSICERLKDAHQLFDESSHRDVVSYNALIDGFVKVGDIAKARELFDTMTVRDAVSWGTLMAGYAQGNNCKEAVRFFDLMMDLEVKPDNVALVSALSACAQLGELEKGMRVHDYIEKHGIRLDSFLSTGLVDFYAKCGCIETAINIFESSPDKSLCTWNAILVGLAIHGRGQLLLSYFSRMIAAGIKPDGVSFLGVLVGCSHKGLVNEAKRLFDEMESVYGVRRELKHYGCMADLLGRAGLIKEAMDMIGKMPMEGDVFVWSGLLGGCRIHGNVQIAEKAAKHVMELKPEDGGVYSVLANVYATTERWEDVMNIRRSLSGNMLVKKNAGYSSIQLEGVIHEFISGDGWHPQMDDLYLVLNVIKEHQLEIY